jgi:hypothetical protein
MKRINPSKSRSKSVWSICNPLSILLLIERRDVLLFVFAESASENGWRNKSKDVLPYMHSPSAF